jgi:hypothetical protein
MEAIAGRVGGGLGDEDGVIDPDGAVKRGRLEAAAVERGKLGRTVRGGRGAPGAGRRSRRRGAPSEETLDAAHEHVEGGTGVSLAEVGGSEATDEAVDTKTAHGLVTEAEARGGVAAHDEAPELDHMAVLVDGEDAGPKGFARATREDAEVICVFQVLGEHEVALVEQGGKLRDGKIPHAPWVLEGVGVPGV